MMKKLPHYVLLSLLLLGGIGVTPFLGCSFLKKTIGWVVSRPQVKVRHVVVKKASLQGVLLDIGLVINNPNQFDLTLSNLKYNLHINEELLAEGAYKEKLTIPTDETLHVSLPITIDPARSFGILRGILQHQAGIVAKWNATAFFASPVGDIEISFNDERSLY